MKFQASSEEVLPALDNATQQRRHVVPALLVWVRSSLEHVHNRNAILGYNCCLQLFTPPNFGDSSNSMPNIAVNSVLLVIQPHRVIVWISFACSRCIVAVIASSTRSLKLSTRFLKLHKRFWPVRPEVSSPKCFDVATTRKSVLFR
jgi:hypothetical protein